MRFHLHSLFLFLSSLCLLHSEDKIVRSSPATNLHVHSFNVDLELVDGEGNWRFKEVWGISYLYQSSDGFVTLWCLGECHIKGEIPQDDDLHLHHFYGNLYVDQMQSVHAEIIGGDVAMYNVKNSKIKQSSGELELVLPFDASAFVLKSRGDVSLFIDEASTTEIKTQGKGVLHLVGENEIYIQSNAGQVLWNGQDSFVDNIGY